MSLRSTYRAIASAGVFTLFPATAQQEAVSLAATESIRVEAFEQSAVMKYAWHLTEVHGPRLTGSPGLAAAMKWAESELRRLGLRNVHSEIAGRLPWGWQATKFLGQLVEPQYASLVGVPLAWAPGTKGKVVGTPSYIPMQNASECQAQVDNLKGKIVLMRPPRQLGLADKPLFRRLTAAELAEEESVTGTEMSDMPGVPSPSTAARGETANRTAELRGAGGGPPVAQRMSKCCCRYSGDLSKYVR